MDIINRVGQYLQATRAWYTRDVSTIKVFSVHHSASFDTDKTDEEILQELTDDHTKKGWPGLSYHFVIIRGKVYQINELGWVTWVDSINFDCIGICVVGYFHPPYNQEPSPENLAALGQLLDELSTQHPEFPATQKDTYGHRERFATACPGDNLFPYVLEYRSKVGDVSWKTTQPTAPAAPQKGLVTTIVPEQQYGQEQLPASLFNVTDGDHVEFNGEQLIAHVNDNGTRSFSPVETTVTPESTPATDPVAPEQPTSPINTPQPEASVVAPQVEDLKYTETQYAEMQRERDEAKTLLQEKSNELIDTNKKYSGFVALGYNVVDDIQKILSGKDEANKGLYAQIVNLKQQLVENHSEDITALSLGQEAMGELKNLKADHESTLVALGVDKPDINTVLSHVDNLHRIVDAAVKLLEKQNVIKPETVQKFQEKGSGWLSTIATFFTCTIVFFSYAIYFYVERGWH